MYGDIRRFLLEISHCVKLTYYCKLLNIDSGNLTKFMKGYDKAVYIDKLVSLCDLIRNDLSKKIA